EAGSKAGEVVRLDGRNPWEIKQPTAVNDDVLAGRKLGKVQDFWYTSTDGLKIQGWYITPPDFDPGRKYPMQLHIHGGPHGMYGNSVKFGWQEMAASGYVMLYTNPRGRAGYGSQLGNETLGADPAKSFHDATGVVG